MDDRVLEIAGRLEPLEDLVFEVHRQSGSEGAVVQSGRMVSVVRDDETGVWIGVKGWEQ